MLQWVSEDDVLGEHSKDEELIDDLLFNAAQLQSI
jgi:hypothetical protein